MVTERVVVICECGNDQRSCVWIYKLDSMQCTYKVLQITAAAYAYHMKETNFGYGIRTSENIFDINCHIMVHLIIGNHLKLMSLRGNNEN
jgi:hypothetical protein